MIIVLRAFPFMRNAFRFNIRLSQIVGILLRNPKANINHAIRRVINIEL
jgi:hypothetical protein